MRNGRKLYVVYVGCPGFPYGLAAIQKMRLIARSLVEAGAEVTVISNRSVHAKDMKPVLPACGTFEGIGYIYTSGDPRRPDAFLRRTLMKVAGVWGEFRYIRKLSREGRLDAAIVVSLDFLWVFYYKILSRMYHFKIAYDYVEYVSGIPSRKGWYYTLNDRLVDRYALSLADGILPISDFLAVHVQRTIPGKPVFCIPVLVDMERFAGPPVGRSEKYFLYCGSLAYYEVIPFIMDAFELVGEEKSGWFLNLVVNGRPDQHRRLQEELAQRGRPESVRIYSNLSDEYLTSMLVNASGLLIPLRPTVQDRARFPHKIGEYLATGRPVITTKYGEIPRYLTDGENAVVAAEYDVGQYCDKLRWVIRHPEEARMIGARGRNVAQQYFNYQRYGEGLLMFLRSLCDGRDVSPEIAEHKHHHQTFAHVRDLRRPL